MSTIIMTQCWPLQMSSAKKAVLVSLADNANDQGCCWPGLSSICQRTCLKRRAVIYAIEWLEKHNALRIERISGKGNRYHLTPDKYEEDPCTKDTSARYAPVHEMHQPVHEVHRTRARGAPKPSRTVNNRHYCTEGKPSPRRRPAEKKPSKRAAYPQDFELAWKLKPERNGANPKRAAYRAWCARRKEGVTAEEITAGVRRYGHWCEATGKIGTELVKQMASFLGPDHHFAEPWGMPTRRHNHAVAV